MDLTCGIHQVLRCQTQSCTALSYRFKLIKLQVASASHSTDRCHCRTTARRFHSIFAFSCDRRDLSSLGARVIQIPSCGLVKRSHRSWSQGQISLGWLGGGGVAISRRSMEVLEPLWEFLTQSYRSCLLFTVLLDVWRHHLRAFWVLLSLRATFGTYRLVIGRFLQHREFLCFRATQFSSLILYHAN